MRVVLHDLDRPGGTSSLKIYARKIERALREVAPERGGSDSIERDDLAIVRGGRGGILRPALFRTFRSFPKDGKLHHATEPSVALRGSDVVTLHDLTAYRLVGLVMAIFRQELRSAARRGRALIVESGVVADDVGRFLGARQREKVAIIPPPFPEVAPGRPSPAYDVVWLGTLEPRKGATTLMRTLASVRSRRLRVAFLCHPVGGSLEEVEGAVAAARERHDVDWIREDVSDARLDSLYRGATVFVSTSVHEGYHAPVMEAYSRGTALLLPDRPLYREIYGGVPGVRYYAEGTGFAGPLDELLGAGPFVPDASLLRSVSYASVGRAVWAVYEGLPGRP